MTPQLAALFAAHKTAILGGGAAAVAGLALLQKRKKATGTAPAASTPAGTIPAAGVVPATGSAGGAYSSGNIDLYNALQPELEALRQTSSAGAGVSVPAAPIASTLFAPTGSGHYVNYGQTVAEVESDGSLFNVNLDQWKPLVAAGARPVQLSTNDTDEPTYYNSLWNLAAKNAKAPTTS